MLHQQVTGIAELGGHAAAFAGQARLGIGGGAVGLVAPSLAVVVHLGVPSRPGGPLLPSSSLGRKLLCEAQASSRVPSTLKCWPER